ncbi:MAG: ABC transporter ATP-binding protein [Clostridioides sp.]|jgi:iron complex transport system ATP-binding protein|nr:ABC transporter ATP-binding protein [Clostridioides sp.]
MLKIKNLSAGYGDFQVLRNISFQINKGENLSILGPNGCGKTTLLRSISNLVEFSGEVTLDDKSIKSMKRSEIASKIALMSQISTVYFPYTVFEIVMMGRYHKIKNSFFSSPSKTDKEFVEHCLEYTGLEDLRNRPINTLSGGQLQRVYLARTLAQDPQIILLDEPNNHMDIKHQIELLDYLRKFSEDKEHIIIGVFHDINLALSFTEKVMFLKDGDIRGFGNFKNIVSGEFLEGIYDLDVLSYMQKNDKIWNEIKR